MFDLEGLANRLRTNHRRRGFLGAAGQDLLEQRQPFRPGAQRPPHLPLVDEDEDPTATRPVTRSIRGSRPGVWPPK